MIEKKYDTLKQYSDSVMPVMESDIIVSVIGNSVIFYTHGV